MELPTAAIIAQNASGHMMEFRDRIKAIAMLRRETGMGFVDAKKYLEQFDSTTNGTAELHVALFEKLCADFVPTLEEQIEAKKAQIHKLIDEVDDLERQIAERDRASEDEIIWDNKF